MARVTGLGGIFLVVPDVDASRKWYADVLGLGGEYGAMLDWSDDPAAKPFSLLSHFSSGDYLKPSAQPFMINLRVDDIDAFVAELRAKGVEILGESDEGYGKFAWILDPDGIKIELWQQVEAAPE